MLRLFFFYSIESFIAQQAFYRYGFVAVPIHDLRSSELLIEIVNQTKMKAIVVAQKALPLLLQSLKDCTSIKTIFVSTIYISEEHKRIAAQYGARLLKFAEVEVSGSLNPLDAIKPGKVAPAEWMCQIMDILGGLNANDGSLVNWYM